MDFITDLFSGLAGVDYQLIVQVALLAAVVLSADRDFSAGS